MKVTFDLQLQKSHSEIVLFMQLMSLHPALWAVYSFTALFAWIRWKKNVLITSMYRGDNINSLHAYNRAIDIDVDEKEVYGGLFPLEALELRNRVNNTFEYDQARPEFSVCVYGDNDRGNKHWDHIHLQVHPRTQPLITYLGSDRDGRPA